jgi:hypothetical protein
VALTDVRVEPPEASAPGDIDPAKAKVMYAVQQPLSMSTPEDVMGTPAWKALPTWYLVATEDQAILPDAERAFASHMGATTVEPVIAR